jgi:hypothetical protein
MDSDESYQDEIYEKLSAAIMNSITSSKDVKELLKELGSNGLITESAVFNLLLSLEELDDYVNPKPFSEKIYKLEPSGEPPKPKTILEFGFANKEETQASDGQRLSNNEQQFEDYCNSDFDQKDWLKKARIKL